MLAVVAVSFLLSSAPYPSASSAASPHARAAGSSARADEFDAPIAPDGRAGFGLGRTRRELEKLFRAPSDDERAFLTRDGRFERIVGPGRFTAFAAFEWSAAAHGANLHRNVIFRGAAPPQPFSSFDSRNPEDLWHWLDIMRQHGYEALAIPHNANASNGLMYDWLDSVSGYIDRNYAQARQAHEPLSEISQNKGASETHPLLSPNDEFANHEIFDYMAGDRRYEGRVPGSYLRDALGRGAVLQREVGVNPFKYGFVGASDLHSGLSVSAQADYGGSYYRPNLGAGRPRIAANRDGNDDELCRHADRGVSGERRPAVGVAQ